MNHVDFFYQNIKILSYEGEFDHRTSYKIYFSIPAGYEAEATQELLFCLDNHAEIHLTNEYTEEMLDNGVYFKRMTEGLFLKRAGHRWSSNWEPLKESKFGTMVAELAPYNRGADFGEENGSLIWDVKIESKNTPNNSMDVRAKQ